MMQALLHISRRFQPRLLPTVARSHVNVRSQRLFHVSSRLYDDELDAKKALLYSERVEDECDVCIVGGGPVRFSPPGLIFKRVVFQPPSS
jgi:hypothetical protein